MLAPPSQPMERPDPVSSPAIGRSLLQLAGSTLSRSHTHMWVVLWMPANGRGMEAKRKEGWKEVTGRRNPLSLPRWD